MRAARRALLARADCDFEYLAQCLPSASEPTGRHPPLQDPRWPPSPRAALPSSLRPRPRKQRGELSYGSRIPRPGLRTPSVYITGCGPQPGTWRRRRTAGGYSPKYTVLSHLGHLEAMVGALGRSAPSTRARLCAAARSCPARLRTSIGSETWAGPLEPAPWTPAAGRAAGGAHLPGSEGPGLAPPTPE